jgi:hypothetical protein
MRGVFLTPRTLDVLKRKILLLIKKIVKDKFLLKKKIAKDAYQG